MTLYPLKTISYKTWVKSAIVLGLREVMQLHPDDNLRWQPGAEPTGTKVTLEAPTTRAHYPAIVVKFYGRNIQNVGVGSYEVAPDNTVFEHYWYDGDIALEIHALDPRTMDYLSNTVIQTITLGNLEDWTNQMFVRLYELTDEENPDAAYNYLSVNSDKVSEFGESKEPAPWGPEDGFIYRNNYRVAVLGEYYSVPETPRLGQLIEHINFYPYDSAVGEPVPEGTDDPAPWRHFGDLLS